MRARNAEIDELRREVKWLRSWCAKLARAVLTHTRTDLAPDAALPKMRALVHEVSRRQKSG